MNTVFLQCMCDRFCPMARHESGDLLHRYKYSVSHNFSFLGERYVPIIYFVYRNISHPLISRCSPADRATFRPASP